MRENEFEKRVQKMMEEWKVRPSVSVWPGVERRIREKKRRRRWLLIIPILAGLALSGYFVKQYFLEPNEFQPKVFTEIENNKQNTHKIPVNSAHEKNLKKIRESEYETSLSSPSSDKKNRQAIERTQYGAGRIDSEFGFYPGKKKRRIDDKTATPPILQNVSSNLNEFEKHPPVPGMKESENNKIDYGNSAFSRSKTYKSNDRDDNEDVHLPANESQNNPSKSIKKKSENKIIWGFHFSAGISRIGNHLFTFSTNRSTSYSAPANQGTGGGLSYPSFSNKIKAGAGYQAGIIGQKKISERSSISTGLQYDYYSNHMMIGDRIDSSTWIPYSYSTTQVSRFYQNGSRYKYTNRYHLISLPVSYHYNLNIGKKLPFSWDMGLVISGIISTNALVFDTASGGIYFKDDNLVRKTQTSLSTGFSVTLNKNKSVQFIIGPQFEFALNSLYQKQFDKTKYLFYGGMNINLFFPGK